MVARQCSAEGITNTDMPSCSTALRNSASAAASVAKRSSQRVDMPWVSMTSSAHSLPSSIREISTVTVMPSRAGTGRFSVLRSWGTFRCDAETVGPICRTDCLATPLLLKQSRPSSGWARSYPICPVRTQAVQSSRRAGSGTRDRLCLNANARSQKEIHSPASREALLDRQNDMEPERAVRHADPQRRRSSIRRFHGFVVQQRKAKNVVYNYKIAYSPFQSSWAL